MTRLIAFYGYKSSGKSEAAKHLVDVHGFTRHSFATPLKSMLQAIGLKYEHLWGDQKEVPLDVLCGKTPRWAMQSLGTEWGRNLIGGNIWVNAWKATLPDGKVVIDDLRFPNEAAAIKLAGGTIVKIVRPGIDVDPSHESEKYVEGEEALAADFLITNNDTLNDLRNQVDLVCAMTRSEPDPVV